MRRKAEDFPAVKIFKARFFGTNSGIPDVSIAYRVDGVLSPDFGGYTMQNFYTQAAEFEMNWRF